MKVKLTLTFILLVWMPWSHCMRLDNIASFGDRAVQTQQLEHIIQMSANWLHFRSVYLDYPVLKEYAGTLRLVLRPSCRECLDYFEAVAVVKGLGKTINRIIKDDKHDVHFPVVRRSYVAVVWVLQRSKLFLWETSHLQSNVLSTMFRLYSHHVARAKGRAVSFHHISKCGGTTMCQLAASNRCSNPFLNQEKNCVLSSRLDGPVWMVAHDVTPTGAAQNLTKAALDVDASAGFLANPFRFTYSNRYATEPSLPMWLMYSCPYVPNGRLYSCRARSSHVQESGTTFMANERTLSKEYGISQVCPEFLNAVILREPVPHTVSLMAEVKYRYVRQLQFRHRINSWQPPAWNLTWWETFGPALVGNYATRTLIGRDSFCRSAANMSRQQLHEAVDSLMGFDVVMTLGRSNDMDLLISTLMGWPAQNFTSQPKARVRDVTAGQVPIRYGVTTSFWPEAAGGWSSTGQSVSSSGTSSSSGASGSSIALPVHRNAVLEANQASRSSSSSSDDASSADRASASTDRAGGSSTGSGTTAFESGNSRDGSLKLPGEAPLPASIGGSYTGSSNSDYNDKPDDPYSDSHYEDQGGRSQQGGKSEAGAYNEGRDEGAYSDRKDGAYAGGDGTDDADTGIAAADSAESDQQQQSSSTSGSSSWFRPSWISTSSNTGSGSGSEEDVNSDELFEKAAAELEEPFEEPPPPPAIPPEVLAVTGAITLVKSSWQERWALQMGYPNISAASLALPDPHVEYTDAKDQYDGYLVRVTTSNQTHNETELWHAFPRHAFAFTASDMRHLERLTSLDGELVQVADLLLDLDVIWIRFLLHNHHYKKKMKAAAATYTACGFAGMMPLTESVQNHIFR